MNEDKKTIHEFESEIATAWNEQKIFHKTFLGKDAHDTFSFFDGPPFATGLPHYGHILASVLKDTVLRYRVMQGKCVRRVWGWDCHGLPIENLIEKEIGLSNKREIESYGIGAFNGAARDSVLRYDAEWKKVIPQIGRWIDMDGAYKTMDNSYIESVWWAFKTLYDKSLIYQDFKSMHICPRCETTLSNNEVSDGYKDITDISVTIACYISERSASILAWTTTPWTLPGNVALAVNKNEMYATVESDGTRYIVAAALVANVFEGRAYEIIETYPGVELLGLTYDPPFDTYKNDAMNDPNGTGWRVYHADFVSMDSGTGVVHIAPAFGEDDMSLGRAEKLPFIQHVGMNGCVKPEVTEFAGLSVKPKGDHQSTDVLVIKKLAASGILFAKQKIVHSYPHCWRCDTPLLNYAAESWFVAVTAMKPELLAANKTTTWVPGNIRDGRFGNWLENARDWAISRSRYWGAPLPVWTCDACGKRTVVASRNELAMHSSVSPDKIHAMDLHRPMIDDVVWGCVCGGIVKRVPYVFDCWFESGSMPYAQFHYPFENQDIFEQNFPADFIAEGVDQTRGWFYSLLVLSVGLFGVAPFKNVIVSGMVLAENGEKMSKKLRNYPDPLEVIGRYGADMVRLYLLASPVVHAESLSFVERGVDELVKKVRVRLMNTISLYELCGGDEISDDIVGQTISTHPLDIWMLSRMNFVRDQITDAFEQFTIDKTVRPLIDVIDDISTWYVRCSRDRFKSDDDNIRVPALVTLRTVLKYYALLMAPSMPFLAEYVYGRMRGVGESVHLATWPKGQPTDASVLDRMNSVRALVSEVHELRVRAGIKVRQPLARVSIGKDVFDGDSVLQSVFLDEVNVKEVVIESGSPVVLDTTITKALAEEGVVRDFLRMLQEFRKRNGLVPTDMVGVRAVVPDADFKVILAVREVLMERAILSKLELESGLEHEKPEFSILS